VVVVLVFLFVCVLFPVWLTQVKAVFFKRPLITGTIWLTVVVTQKKTKNKETKNIMSNALLPFLLAIRSVNLKVFEMGFEN